MKPTTIEIDAERCSKDGLCASVCASVCPSRIFEWKPGGAPDY